MIHWHLLFNIRNSGLFNFEKNTFIDHSFTTILLVSNKYTCENLYFASMIIAYQNHLSEAINVWMNGKSCSQIQSNFCISNPDKLFLWIAHSKYFVFLYYFISGNIHGHYISAVECHLWIFDSIFNFALLNKYSRTF